jgi:hypothetical protein
MFERAKSVGRTVKSLGKRFPYATSVMAGSLAYTVADSIISGRPNYQALAISPFLGGMAFKYDLDRNIRRELEEMYPLSILLLMEKRYDEARRVNEMMRRIDETHKE